MLEIGQYYWHSYCESAFYVIEKSPDSHDHYNIMFVTACLNLHHDNRDCEKSWSIGSIHHINVQTAGHLLTKISDTQ